MSSGTHAVAHQLEHLGGDQLGLGALAARLQQPHRPVRRARSAPGSNSPRSRWCSARARRGRVVLGAVLEDLVALGERLEQLDRRRATRERGTAGLVAQRDADASAWRASVSIASRWSAVRSSNP